MTFIMTCSTYCTALFFTIAFVLSSPAGRAAVGSEPAVGTTSTMSGSAAVRRTGGVGKSSMTGSRTASMGTAATEVDEDPSAT